MKVEFQPSRIKETKWYEYLLRFVFGGLITALAGLIAKQFGPAYGGLFLGFPAILPAALTLVESHESKESHRLDEAKDKAGEDSMGATLGSLGLVAFAVTVWLLPSESPIAIVGLAFVMWIVVALGAWFGFQMVTGRARREAGAGPQTRPTAQTSKTA